MSRSAQVAAGGLLRALQRVPGAGFVEASTVLRAGLCSDALLAGSTKSLPWSSPSTSGYKAHLPMLSFAAQMHSLASKDEENKQAGKPSELIVRSEVPRAAAAALTLLPPKAGRTTALAHRGMSSAAGVAHAHHFDSQQAHPYHLVAASPWPFLACQGAFTMCLGMSGWFHAIPHSGIVMAAGMGSMTATAVAWWRDCIIESDMGMHSEIQKQNFLNGIWGFMASELAVFFGLIWSSVHLGMSPSVAVQMQWPPLGIEAIGWEGRAMVMSAVLAASYYSANVAMVAKDPKAVVGALGVTVALGALFLADQYLEYSTAPFNITDGPYGTTFFMTTGFHGLHVLVGTLWLLVATVNYPRYNKPTVTMKGAVLYWHFVDLLWIAVYGVIYAAQL